MTIGHTPPAYNQDSNSGRILLHGTFIGIIKNNNDVQSMGRLQVYIPELSGLPNDPTGWITVGYASMFGGATNPTNIQNNQTMAGTQTSYGWWGVPPDLNNQVLVTFVNGDLARGYWFACVYQQNMNQMVPGIASAQTNDPNYSKPTPTVEYNKLNAANPTSPSRAVFTPLASGLTAEGLTADPLRGPSTASARRAGVSQVYGLLTPNSNQLYIDDGANQYIRLRTRSGTQVLVNDTTGFVYINSPQGNSWMEISDAGIDVYSLESVSIRAQKDFNVHADNNIILEAGGSIYMRSVVDLNIQVAGKVEFATIGDIVVSTTGDLTLTVQKDFLTQVTGNQRSQTTGDTSVNAANHIIQTSNQISNKADTKIILQAPSILDNPGNAPSAPSVPQNNAQVPTPVKAYDISGGAVTSVLTITNRLPTHEPWPVHPTVASSSTTATTAGTSGGSSSSSASSASSSSGSTGSSSSGNTGGAASSGSSSGAASGNTSGVPGLPANANTVVSQYSGTSVGNGQCVALVKAATGLGATSTWAQGQAITPDNLANVPAGTPIATFQNGAYQNATNGDSHAAIYLGPGTTPSGQPGITVLDQWSNSPATPRVIPFNAYNALPCNNASSFSVVNSKT